MSSSQQRPKGEMAENESHLTTERLNRNGTRLSDSDLEDVGDRLRLRAAVVYEIIRQEGEEELARAPSSLWWSGIAAGLSIGFSVLGEALLRTHLPDTGWRHLVENAGYGFGFLIVILARQQLFTENTLTAVLPALSTHDRRTYLRVARLWLIVLVANLVGTFLFGSALASGLFFSEDLTTAIGELSSHLMELPPSQMFLRGVVAGWIVATLVWLLPSAENAKIAIVMIMAWLIAALDLTHVVAGSVEAVFAFWAGKATVLDVLAGFLLPTLAGNIVGGSALFALLAHAQVSEEI
ncbi:formate/nitrite transporter family protein [Roseibium aggregatum]|uniref:Formate/nitrite transporter family protein n=1 Tax=Roseibium aggregatum TaxID=187304 RepID=A0A939EC84_9HYPH|nr:formate/nitrite transporter family protein [Roseibium aggregatum]MBN9669413.1 formate/nitrite transporter family protein [Roseibium aggregatum]